jgi:sugar phosphate isomerase/epimerase
MNESFTRRAFLTRAAQCGAAAVLPCLPACRVLQPPGAGPVGIQLYAVKDELRADPEATLAAIRKIGFGEVETAGFGTLTAQQFRRLLDAAGLECPSAHLQFDNLDAAFAPHASPPAGAELGHGMIDYAPIFAAAEKAGLEHYFAEQEGPFTRMTELQAAQQAFDYLRKLH